MQQEPSSRFWHSLTLRAWSTPIAGPGRPQWMPATWWMPWADSWIPWIRRASDGGKKLVVSLWQCPSSYGCCGHKLDSSLTDQGDRTPAIFARPGTSWLFSSPRRREIWLADLTLTQKTFKKEWEGPVQTISAEDFVKTICPWYELKEKCIAVAST